MGATCSKSPSPLDDSTGGALESDPRQRRNHNKKGGLSLSSSSGQHYLHHNSRVSSHGIYKSDPPLFELQLQSLALNGQESPSGQYHLLYKQQQKSSRSIASASVGRRRRTATKEDSSLSISVTSDNEKFEESSQDATKKTEAVEVSISESRSILAPYNTRLVVRRHTVRSNEEGLSGRHIYAIRWPRNAPLQLSGRDPSPLPLQEQSPFNAASDQMLITSSLAHNPLMPNLSVPSKSLQAALEPTANLAISANAAQMRCSVDSFFSPSALSTQPKRKVVDWVVVSEAHSIFVADVGLTPTECDHLVQVTEQVCGGQYAAYTYAKQTLGCREFPILASAVKGAVHTVVNAIFENAHGDCNIILSLDDREPHMVKYDVTKKERQKLDMHTDKSEWTFLVALSNGCGMDYEGGGTYFEVLDATLHVQRGHAVIFPGKLRHCGQRISAGVRFLLVGFLVDKNAQNHSSNTNATPNASTLQKRLEDDEDSSSPRTLTNAP